MYYYPLSIKQKYIGGKKLFSGKILLQLQFLAEHFKLLLSIN